MVAKCPNLSKICYQHIELVTNVRPELQWCCASQQWYFISLHSTSYHILCVIAVAFRDGSNRIIVSWYCYRFFFYSWVHLAYIILFNFLKWCEESPMKPSWVGPSPLWSWERVTDLVCRVFCLEYWTLHRVQKSSKLKMMLMICIRNK